MKTDTQREKERERGGGWFRGEKGEVHMKNVKDKP